MSSGNCQMRKSCCLREPASTQYKARVRQITLLFPHDSRLGTALLRRKVPVTTPATAMRSLIRKRPGNAWPFVSSQRPCRTVEILLRRGRQRSRVVRKGTQIGDHVGALAVLRKAGEAHRGAGNEAL